MIWWGWVAVLIVVFLAGWRSHWWYCKHRLGCPLWYLDDAAEWSRRLKAEGWRTKNGARHHVGEQHERRPTGEVKMPTFDKENTTGVPLARIEPTPTTDVTNTRRKT